MRRNAFVTGATGFIGRRLVKHLLNEGWHVRALVPPDEPLSVANGVELIRGDITDSTSLHGTMEDTDATFHLAALVDSWIPDPREFTRVNVEGTDNVVEEALRAGVWRFLFTSSLSGIGVRSGKVMREDSPPGKAFGPYEESKAVAERHVTTAVRDRGLPAITLIPSIVIGPGDVRNTGKFLLSFVRGEYPGTFAEESWLPVVGVDDVARAHLLAYERGRVGERYIISAKNVKWGNLMRYASQVSATPMPSRHIGARALWLASRGSEMMSRVTRAPPRLPAWLADFLLTGARMDNSKSIRELGMVYHPVSDSLRDAVGWFREQGLLKQPRVPVSRPVIPGPVENPPMPALRDTPPEPSTSGVSKAATLRRPKPPEGHD